MNDFFSLFLKNDPMWNGIFNTNAGILHFLFTQTIPWLSWKLTLPPPWLLFPLNSRVLDLRVVVRGKCPPCSFLPLPTLYPFFRPKNRQLVLKPIAIELYYSLAHPFHVIFTPFHFLEILAPDPLLVVVVQRQTIINFSDFNIHADTLTTELLLYLTLYPYLLLSRFNWWPVYAPEANPITVYGSTFPLSHWRISLGSIFPINTGCFHQHTDMLKWIIALKNTKSIKILLWFYHLSSATIPHFSAST